MSDRAERFSVGEAVRIEITTTSGDITVVEGEAGVVDVRLDGSVEGYRVELVGDTILIEPDKSKRRRFWSTDIMVLAPAGASITARCTSGDIKVTVPVEEFDGAVASGDIRVLEVRGSARVKAASGDVTIDDVREHLNLSTASGAIRIGNIRADAVINSASGDVIIDDIEGTARLHTASGDVIVRRLDGSRLLAKTLSGNLKIGIPPQRRVDFDVQSLSGEMRTDLPPGDGSPPERTIEIKVKTISGDVLLVGA